MKRLVILSPNWLGDAVMALPAIADVRRAAPDAVITVAARAAIAPLFRLVPTVDDTIVLSKPAAIHDVLRWRRLGALILRSLRSTRLEGRPHRDTRHARGRGDKGRWVIRRDDRAQQAHDQNPVPR